MTVDFCDNFWGEKNNGFDILYHNMKYGQLASKELAEFFRERSFVEENQSKLLSKLAKQAGNCSSNGTFAPLWQVLKVSSEKLSTLHMQMVQRFQDLVKDVNRYCDEQHKKHKAVKDEESGTLETVQAIHSTSVTLLKAKETYNQRCIEYEKLKRENASPKEIEKSETKYKKAGDEYRNLVEKYSLIREDFEKKMTISCRHFQDVEQDHLKRMKLFLENYAQVLDNGHALIGQVRVEFKQHCHQMTVEKLLEQFVQLKGTGSERPGPIEFEEVDLSCLSSLPSPESDRGTTNGDSKPPKKEGNKSPGGKSKPSRRTTSLLNLFLSTHGTSATIRGQGHGDRPTSPLPTSPPGSAGSEQRLPATANGSNTDISRNTFRGSKWFLKSRRERKKKKKQELSNKDDKSDGDRRDDKEDPETPTIDSQVPDVDEEGFTIRPDGDHRDHKTSFYSTSDSDSDEDREKKIHIEIKPLTNGGPPLSASIDELRASVGGLTLSPVGVVSSHRNRPQELPLKSRRTPTADIENAAMKRSMSVSQSLGKPSSSDLLGLGLQQQNTAPSSSASTPTGAYGGISSPTSTGRGSTETTPTPTKYEELGDLFSEFGDLPPALPPKHSQQNSVSSSNSSRGSTPVGSLIPRPPSRRAIEGPVSRGRVSPISPMSRTDSVSSLSNEFRASSMSVGSSRGPSPLTIGMSDTIPLAVAFQEIVHAYFQGNDETKYATASTCQVRLTGDMMLSFPAGIVQVLANNPSPAVLAFRLRNPHKLESVLPNKQLISLDASQLSNDNHVYEFNMMSLTSLLRRQAEQNPSASYFNVDILKYKIKCLPGAQSTPLQLVAYWKCESQFTDLKVDYKYNGSAMMAPFPLLNLSILVPVDGGVVSMQSKPNGTWVPETQRAMWRFTELSQHSDNNGMGSLRARFELKSGPSYPSTLAAQFSCEGATFSGADFELVGMGYRLSLVKRRFITGKYICDTEPDMKNRYAPPP